jgi:hypothetical protein
MELVTGSGAVCARTPQKTISSRSKNSSHIVPEIRLPFFGNISNQHRIFLQNFRSETSPT